MNHAEPEHVTDFRGTTHSPTGTHHPVHSDDLFECISAGRIFVTVAPYGWLTYLRRESADEYAVRFENANGVLSGTLTLDQGEARRLLIEKVCEAVWIDLRPRTAWPTADEHVEVSA
jgi:hypothetical protein